MEDSKSVGNASSTAFGGAAGLSRRGENRPLLPEAERRKSKMLMSVQADIGRGVMFTLRLSKWYLFYCTLMAIATLSLVLYMIIDIHVKGNPLTVWAVAVDGTITLTMCIETVADMLAVGKHFWETGWHVFDFGVAVTSLVSWLLMLLEVVGVITNFDQYVTIILLTCRYTAQTIRIIRYIRTGAEAQDAQATVEEQPVIFDPHAGMPTRDFEGDLERGDSQYVSVERA